MIDFIKKFYKSAKLVLKYFIMMLGSLLLVDLILTGIPWEYTSKLNPVIGDGGFVIYLGLLWIGLTLLFLNHDN